MGMEAFWYAPVSTDPALQSSSLIGFHLGWFSGSANRERFPSMRHSGPEVESMPWSRVAAQAFNHQGCACVCLYVCTCVCVFVCACVGVLMHVFAHALTC